MNNADRGTFFGGEWVPGKGAEWASKNPARDHLEVWRGRGSGRDQVDEAVQAARSAFPRWAAASPQERADALLTIVDGVEARGEELATAITSEMGKPIREARAEARSLTGKVRASLEAAKLLPDLALPGAPGETRWRPHGVMAVIGPYNYPIHLLHTHVVPALLAGNTVVIKPSSVTPLSGQIYTEMMAAILPPGVFNLVHGPGGIAGALAAHPELGGIAFTGAWGTGRRILEANMDQPHKLLALEMGGRNTAVVLEDADPLQTVHELLVGCCLTAGQRCTATSRLMIHESVADTILPMVLDAFGRVLPGDPFEDETLMGPLATESAFSTYIENLKRFESEGAEPLLAPTIPGGGSFVTPSVHRQTARDDAWKSYVSTELFGPDLAVEIITDEDDALDRLTDSPYGLSLSVFSARREPFESFVSQAPSGIFNWNRSTNNASGLLPFGGLGKSGNFRPAGAASALYCAHPVAVLERSYAEVDLDPRFGSLAQAALDAAKT